MTRIRALATCLLLFSNVAFAGPGHQHGPNGEHLSGAFSEGIQNVPVILSDEAIENLEVVSVKVQAEVAAPTRALYGKLIAHPQRVTKLGSGFDGKIEKLFVLEGDQISEQGKLITVLPLQAGGSPVTLRASAEGYVTEVMVTQGETVERGEDLIEVSDLSELLFRAELFDTNLLDKIKSGAPSTVTIDTLEGYRTATTIRSIDSTLRGNPPTLYLYALVENADNRLKPNMTGLLHVEIDESEPRVLVPKIAVLGELGEHFVFVRDGNRFERTNVVLGPSLADRFEVRKGLKIGQEVVIQGQYQLQFAQSSRSMLHEDAHDDEGDDHEHENHDHSH